MSVGNGVTQALRSRVFYLAILIVFGVGVVAGWWVTTTRHWCESLVAQQRRQAIILTSISKAAEQDKALASARTLAALAEEVRETDYPRC